MLKKILILLLCLFIITGCSSETPITYSNLGNDTSKNKLVSILEKADLPSSNIKQFMTYVDIFNQNASPLIGDFEELPNTQPNYEYFNYDIPDEAIPNEPNSLIPTFTLIKDLITTNNTVEENDPYLMYNINLIDTIPAYSMNYDDRLKFIAAFNSISVSGIKNNEISHINQIEKTFNDRSFEVKEKQNVSLITLWCHFSAENRRYVSHCGILINSEDGLYFIEKYGCQYPYQVTRFNDRSEVKTYLLTRNDIKSDENDGHPLVFENNKYFNK